MAGFAVNLQQVILKDAWFAKDTQGQPSQRGHLETDFLEHFVTKYNAECRGYEDEVIHINLTDP